MSADRPFLLKDYAGIVQGLLDDLRKEGITDTTPGSVVRTLVEAFSRELAVSYEQLERIYKFGYLDTAEGVALDQVVALLAIKRRRGDYAEGTVLFERSQPAPEDIPIPRGTRVAGLRAPLFETTGDAVLPRGETSGAVRVRSLERLTEPLAKGVLSVLPRPIEGVELVTNPVPLEPRHYEESDDELRERVRRALAASGRGTVASIEEGIRSLGYDKFTIRERRPDRPGELEVVIGETLSEEEAARIASELEKVRPAGVPLRLNVSTSVGVEVKATLVVEEMRAAADEASILARASSAVTAYFSGLAVNENVRWSKVGALLMDHSAVYDVAQFAIPGGNAYDPYLAGGVLTDDDWKPEPNRQVPENGDIYIGSEERAELRDLTLTIEERSLPVWIDLRIAGTSDKVDWVPVEDYLTQLEGPGPDRYVRYSEILKRLPIVEGLLVTAIYDRDGLVVILDQEGQRITLSEREKPKLRHVHTVEEAT